MAGRLRTYISTQLDTVSEREGKKGRKLVLLSEGLWHGTVDDPSHPPKQHKTKQNRKRKERRIIRKYRMLGFVSVQNFWISLSGSYLRLTPSPCTGSILCYLFKNIISETCCFSHSRITGTDEPSSSSINHYKQDKM